MFDFEVVHVVSSSTGRRVLFGAHDSSVVVHDLLLGRRSPTIRATFDFGGKRLALSDERNAILAAAYHVHGLASYNATTGQELWRRKDLKRIQQINLSRDGLTAYCGIEERSLVAIDVGTGETIQKVRAAYSIHESPYDAATLVDGFRPRVVDQLGSVLFPITTPTFAFLDVAFSPGRLFVSQVNGPVRCFELATCDEKWRYECSPGGQVMTLGYHEQAQVIVGVESPWVKGGHRLVQLSPSGGELMGRYDIAGARDFSFVLAGGILATANGDFIDTATGLPRAERNGEAGRVI